MADPGAFLNNLYDLEGKVAVVVGGTGVLCGAIAKGLIDAGCKAALVGRSQEKAQAHIDEWGADESACFIQADVTARDQVEAIVPAVLEQWGRIDIWINGAGINSPTPYLDIEDDEFGRILDANLKSVHIGCQVAARHWLDSGAKGNIINMSSMSAVRPLSRVFTYSVTKAAVWNLTQNLAREWAEQGIRVNALCPGFFPAEQNRKVLDASRVESIMRQTPMNRFGEAEELVAATLLLASDKAGSFITGANLVVDGGFSVMSI